MAEDADTKSRVALGFSGGLITTAGVSILSPGFKDALLSLLNTHFKLGLYLDPPPWVGALLISIGVLLLVVSFVGQSRIERAFTWLIGRHRATIGTFLAVKHVGFSPVVRDIRQDELPSDLRRRDLRHQNVDLTPELAGTPPALEAALAKQLRMRDKIDSVLEINPDVDLGYCGIVQAPFQVLAGYQLASWTRLRSFEWNRYENRWAALQEGAGIDLGVSSTTSLVGVGDDMAIAIDVSYAIDAAEITASVPGLSRIVRVGVAVPALDCIKHEGQVAELAREFRRVLDAARGVPPGACIHVFCSAPMSVGFALGRMVSRTLHPPVRVYAYDRGAPKPYPWGIEVNGAAGPAVLRN